MPHDLRIARPVSDLARAQAMYCQGLGMRVVGSFENHDGFDGVMLALAGANYHFEFTFCPDHPVAPTPTPEDLAVFYIPDASEWQITCAKMLVAGFRRVHTHNPYWEVHGRAYEDPDGYRVVLQHAKWDKGDSR